MSDPPPPAGSTPRRVRFTPFVFDRGRHQLLRAEEPVHLSPKAYDLLDVLLEAAPRALSKADLQGRLWPETYVSEANLASLVKELRAALGDHGRAGQYIRTVHAFGYAFARPITGPPEKIADETRTPPQWLAWGDRQLPLFEGDQVVGRDAAADLVLDSLSVSRRHARIAVAGARVTLEDLGSKNGTWKRGQRLLGPVLLEDGDELRFGSVGVVFRTVVEPGGTRTGAI